MADARHPAPNPPVTSSHLIVGKVVRPHGITGELKVYLAPEYRGALEGLARVYLNDTEHAYRVLSCRAHQDAILLRLEGITTRNAAEAVRGARVIIAVAELPELPPGSYYAHQLIGLRVLRDNGEVIGELSEVLATGSNDVYVVKTGSGELLLPALESVVRAIDLCAGTMTVVVPEGLE